MIIKKLLDRLMLPPIARQVRAKRLTYLKSDRFLSLSREIKRIKRDNIPGDFYELGIALGGSAIFIASQLDGARRFKGFDVFGMIPPPTENDGADTHARYKIISDRKSTGIGGDKYYGYMGDLYDKVVSNFSQFSLNVDGDRISLHKGLFQDTLRIGQSNQIALAHIDCDWFDPVYYCLSTISPALSPGGTIIVDDYNDYTGCRRAVNLYMESDKTLIFEKRTPHAVIRKC
jgi:asparagine synthase (glutamine-hydrolysing)